MRKLTDILDDIAKEALASGDQAILDLIEEAADSVPPAIPILRESFNNATGGWGIGDEDTPLKDTFLGEDATLADVYRYGRENYGRCVGKMYVDDVEAAKHIGYVFQKKMPYQDAPDEHYIQEVWVSLAILEPSRIVS